MSALEQPFYTPEQYLEMEREAPFKSEYYGGQIFAMSGGSSPHSVIGGNVHALLWLQLRGRDCVAYNSDMKVKVSPSGLFTYPDVSVVCGEVRFHDDKQDMMENPALVVEVLSPSTQDYDRGEKFAHYQRIGSLTDYLIASQDAVRVEHYARQGDSQWLLSVYEGPEAVIPVASIDCELRLSDVYEKVELSTPRNPLMLRRIL